MKESHEITTWVSDYIAGKSLYDIAARYVVPFWRVRNAVLWHPLVADHSLTRYAGQVERVRTLLKANPSATHIDIHMTPHIFRALRYALIVKGEVQNGTRYGRSITVQEETRIAQIAMMQNPRQLTKLGKTTGRSYVTESNVAKRVLGERINEYRRRIGTSIRAIEETYGIWTSQTRRMLRMGVITLPFTDETMIDIIKRGYCLYHSSNWITKPYHDIAAHYRTLYRTKYITSIQIRDVTYLNLSNIHTAMRKNQIPTFSLFDASRYKGFDREKVFQYYDKLQGRKIALQLREYDNDWQHLKCDWYTW